MKIEEFSTAKFFLKQSHQLLCCDCYYNVTLSFCFIDLSLSLHSSSPRTNNGNFKGWLFLFHKVFQKQTNHFGFSKFNQSILRGIYLFWTTITTLIFSFFDRLILQLPRVRENVIDKIIPRNFFFVNFPSNFHIRNTLIFISVLIISLRF